MKNHPAVRTCEVFPLRQEQGVCIKMQYMQLEYDYGTEKSLDVIKFYYALPKKRITEFKRKI